MDPKGLGTAEWQQIVGAVNQFWFFAAFMVVTALSFGLAHAILPSLLATRQVPARLSAVRAPLYAVAAFALLLTAFTLYRAIYMAWSVLRVIYPRWWI